MKITYTGLKEEFTAAQQRKLVAKLSKLAKLMDLKGGEREARVIIVSERRRAEMTVNVLGRPIVGIGSGADEFTALLQAIERLEKQVLKLRAKKRDTKREPKKAWVAGAATAPGTPEEPSGRRVFRVSEDSYQKPMTLEEALLEMDRKRDYVVFRDAETDRLSVLLRRRDGSFDLVEA